MDNEEVAAKARPEIMADLRVGIEEPGVDGGVLVHGDRAAGLRRVPATETLRGHEDRLQRIAPSIRRKLALLDARLETAARGHDPHLDETHRFGLRAVALRVLQPRAERRALDRAGVKDAAVAPRVGVLEGPLGDVGDALDVPMRMHRPGRARHEAIVVEHPQISDPHVGLVPVPIEAEVPVRAEPAAFGVEQRSTRSQQHAHEPPRAFSISAAAHSTNRSARFTASSTSATFAFRASYSTKFFFCKRALNWRARVSNSPAPRPATRRSSAAAKWLGSVERSPASATVTASAALMAASIAQSIAASARPAAAPARDSSTNCRAFLR